MRTEIGCANRVSEGKNNGLIVDYCGILKNLRKALATFAGTADEGDGGKGGEIDPAKPEEELLADLAEAVAFVRCFLDERGALLDDIIEKTGFERNAAIVTAKEMANENDETRKRFEVMCREVFKKFKVCLNVQGVNAHRADYDAINVIYKSLQQDREQADISEIIRQLHLLVNEAVLTKPGGYDANNTRLKAEKLRIDHWRDKETTRDAVHVTIRDYLWSDDTGLPVAAYTEEDVNEKAEEVFRHIYRAYPTLPSPFYASAPVAG